MPDIESLLLYLLAFFVSTIVVFFGVRKNSKLITAAGLTPPVLLAGFRQDVGTDYAAYELMFEQFSRVGLVEYLNYGSDNIEFGFYALIQASNFLTANSSLMFTATAAITIVCTFIAIKKIMPKAAALTYLIYLLVLYPQTLNMMRQGIAISIFFIAVYFIITKKPGKYVLTVLIASLFHTSALYMLPVYFARYLYKSKKYSLFTQFAFAILLASSIYLLLPVTLNTEIGKLATGEYASYAGTDVGTSNFIFLFKAAVVVAASIFYGPLVRKNPTMALMVFLAILELAFIGLGAISGVFARAAYYASLGGFVCLAALPRVFNRQQSRIVQSLAASYALMYFLIVYYYLGYSELFPYQTGGLA
ncbi:hypothetical protein CR983_00070 [Candidatus Saccharibacteria bacterium]|nr:MAG: hypothetical protein CR983_00070 [Candidatus Saccharibacteria bacterium]